MESIIRVRGLNQFLESVYGSHQDLGTLLANLGFDQHQIHTLRRIHLEHNAEFLVASQKERFATYSDGERLYLVLSRRYGLDGRPLESLQSLAVRLGISRERVRQLEWKGLKRCRSRAHRQSWEAGLRALATVLVGDPYQSTAPAPSEPDQARRPISPDQIPAVRLDLRAHEEGVGTRSLECLIASILDAVPDGLTCNLLAHILAGSEGPVVSPLVARHSLPHYGTLRSLGHSTIKQMILALCTGDTGLQLVDGKVRRQPRIMQPHEGTEVTIAIEPLHGRLDSIRAKYPRAYTPWTDPDDTALKEKYRQNMTVRTLSEYFQRQPGAIRSRLRKLGLM